MPWYYAEAGQQTGPIEDAQFEQLVQTGQIKPETLVWREGMANWQAYNELRATASGSYGSAGASAATAVATAAPSEAVCAECGGVFNIQDTIAYGNVRVCARCKPIFIQKLAEGAKLNTGQLNYARFFTRFAAVLVDALILGVVNIAIAFAGGMLFATTLRAPSAGFFVFQITLTMINMGIAVTYETVMIGRFGATLGKMALKVKVVTAEGGKVSHPRAFGRYFAKLLSGMILLIGYIMAAFDDEKRALHDRICNTRVIVNG